MNFYEELQRLWPFIGAIGGYLYWLITQFNSIKSNNATLHAEIITRISETNQKLLSGQEIMSHFQKELSSIKIDVEKLSDNMGRDNKAQAEKFIRIDDKISALQADMGRSMSDTLIHLEHIGRPKCKMHEE